MKLNLMNVVSMIGENGKKNAPALLAGTAIVGLVMTGVMAYRAGIKAAKVLDEKKKDMDTVAPGDEKAKRAVLKETVKEVAPIVAGPVILGTVTAACILGGHKISSKRVAVLSAAYTVAEKSVNDLNAKMTDILGEKKAKSIKDAVVEDRFKKDAKNPGDSTIYVTGGGDVLCYDMYSGRYFRSNAEKIGQAINELSSEVISDNYVELNDFYEILGIPQIPMGSDFGWNVDDLVRSKLPITITALLTEDKQPCLALDYDIRPRADFRNLH